MKLRPKKTRKFGLKKTRRQTKEALRWLEMLFLKKIVCVN